MKIKFSKPKIGETRYLTFYAKHHGHEAIIQKVKITKAGQKWFGGKVLDIISGPEEYADEEEKTTGDYYYYCFLETEEDAKRLMLYAVLEDDDFFYRTGSESL